MGIHHHTFRAGSLGEIFTIDSDYECVGEIGDGGQGYIILVENRINGDNNCAIKKMRDLGSQPVLAAECLRELKLLRHFHGHANISSIFNLDCVPLADPRNWDGYYYMSYTDWDLEKLINTPEQPLNATAMMHLLYQLLRGLKFIHSANVIHSDLTTKNILLDRNWNLRISGFGRAQSMDNGRLGKSHPDHVPAMQRYWAPEIRLLCLEITAAVDIWCVGCILAELLGRKPLFDHEDPIEGMLEIIRYLGTPGGSFLASTSSRLRKAIESRPQTQGIPFGVVFPNATLQAANLLTKLLSLDPGDRLSCDEALEHPAIAYARSGFLTGTEPNSVPFDFTFENGDVTFIQTQNHIRREMTLFQNILLNPPPMETNEVTANIPLTEEAPEMENTPIILERKPFLLSEELNGNWIITGMTRIRDPYAGIPGGYGRVHQGEFQSQTSRKPLVVAIKILHPDDNEDEPEFLENRLRRYAREARLWSMLDHPNIAQFFGCDLQDEGSPRLVSLWYAEGDILKYLRKYKQADRRKLTRDVIRGLEYLHGHKNYEGINTPIVHGDLKPANILVSADGPIAQAVLCDFGMSKIFDGNPSGFTNSNMYGSDIYLAPELRKIENHPRTLQGDVFAFGCIYLEIVFEKRPYQEKWPYQRRQVVLGPEPPYVFSVQRMVDSFCDMVEKCWAVNPDERPNVFLLRDAFDKINPPKIGV